MGFFDRFSKGGSRNEGAGGSHVDEKPVRNENYVSAILYGDRKLRAFLKWKGLQKDAAETGRQFFRRVEQTMAVDLIALYEFMYCVEEARFSNHPVNKRERDRCIIYFRKVNSSLGKPQSGSGNIMIRPWVVPPPFGTFGMPTTPWNPNSFCVPRSEQERNALIEKISSQRTSIGSLLGNEIIEKIKNDILSGNYLDLSKILREQLRGPTANSKLFFDRPLATWIMEWGYQMADTKLLVPPPTVDAHQRMVHGACILAIAERRDFVIPDDIKLAILALSSEIYQISPAESMRLLETIPIPYL
jgi:hypothetical protein